MGDRERRGDQRGMEKADREKERGKDTEETETHRERERQEGTEIERVGDREG